MDEDPSGEAEAEKVLTFYELDLGLNNVVRKWVDPIDNNANLLVPVAGGGDGPGGVIVCAENMVYWKNQVWGKGGGCVRAGVRTWNGWKVVCKETLEARSACTSEPA